MYAHFDNHIINIGITEQWPVIQTWSYTPNLQPSILWQNPLQIKKKKKNKKKIGGQGLIFCKDNQSFPF